MALLSHFVTSRDPFAAMAAPLLGCAERSSPKAACGAPKARGLTANAQPSHHNCGRDVQRFIPAPFSYSPFTDM